MGLETSINTPVRANGLIIAWGAARKSYQVSFSNISSSAVANRLSFSFLE